MKKTFMLIGLICLFGLTSCLSTQVYDSSDITYEQNSTYEAENVKIQIAAIPDSFWGGLKGLSVSVFNQTGKPVFVDFEQSSIGYNMQSYVPFVTGMKYINAGEIPPRKMVANGMSTNFDLYSSEQVRYGSSGWSMSSIESYDGRYIVTLALEIDKEIYYWTTVVNCKSNTEE